jgi:hypothetical protein
MKAQQHLEHYQPIMLPSDGVEKTWPEGLV